MYQVGNNEGYRDVLEKISMKTLAYGEKTMMVEFRLGQGALLPHHSHPHEQTGYLCSGEIMLTIGEKTHNVKAGDSWCIPSGTGHSAVAKKKSIAIEVFSPVRKDYLPTGT